MTRIQSYTVLTPANTAAATPQSVQIQFPPGTTTRIDIKVPPGPSGNLAINVNAGGNNYIPVNTGGFLFPDDDDLSFPVSNAPNSGNWTVVSYNTDVWDHSIYITFHVEEFPSTPIASSTTPIGL